MDISTKLKWSGKKTLVVPDELRLLDLSRIIIKTACSSVRK